MQRGALVCLMVTLAAGGAVLPAAPDGGTASRPEDVFRFFQEDSPGGFATFPVTFIPPPDAARAQVELGVERHGLPQPLTADFDNLR